LSAGRSIIWKVEILTKTMTQTSIKAQI